jgi:hypothetical protein
MRRFAFFVNLLFYYVVFFRRPQLLDFVNHFIGEANYSKGSPGLARACANSRQNSKIGRCGKCQDVSVP